ncbi:MAG: hypothetical protein E7585_01785 [Ruminococcaceae bacterium]|nr:hypothetical protein [Oscillospiraceae bacterium]
MKHSKQTISQAAHQLYMLEAEVKAGYHRQVHELQEEFGSILTADERKGLYLSRARTSGLQKSRDAFSKLIGSRKRKTNKNQKKRKK